MYVRLASGQLECHQLDQLCRPRIGCHHADSGLTWSRNPHDCRAGGSDGLLACAAGHGRTRQASKGRKATDPPEAVEKRMRRKRWRAVGLGACRGGRPYMWAGGAAR
jgi:hypothetical protein